MSTATDRYWIPPLDYVAYGTEPPSKSWPGGKKVAVNFVLNFEEGAEWTPWNNDDSSCDYLHELHYERRATTNGKRDIVVEEMFEYALRQGFPRLIRIFREFGWKWTTWACGRAFETSGPYPKLIVEEGHEIACHGNRWLRHGDSVEETKAHLHKSFDRLQAATGLDNVPTGWYTGTGPISYKLARAEVHRERGVPLLYCSDTYASDTPYWVQDPDAVMNGGEDHGMLMIPYTLCTNDHRFFVAQGAGVSAPEDWFEMLKAEYEQLSFEGSSGAPKMMTVALHSRFIGKPGRFMALRRFMEYLKSQPGAWVCTRAEIASFWRENYPYELVGSTDRLHD